MNTTKAVERESVPVQMTRKGREMFRPPYTGMLVRIAQDGRWVVKRENRATVDYWEQGFWRRVRGGPETEAKNG